MKKEKYTLKFIDGGRTLSIGCDSDTMDAVRRMLEAVARAEELHPCFAEGVYQGLGAVSEEAGELASALNKRQPTSRIHDEALDLLVVAFRFYRRDWFMEDADGADKGEPVGGSNRHSWY